MAISSPFSDLIVLELASVLAGPSTGQFFAELGATVIKVENTETKGDVTRQWKSAKEKADTDISAYFSCANWGKKSVALNLKSKDGLEAVQKMAAKADILIASYKPGDAEKLRVDYETLSAVNPRLIYGQITGYGTDNPRTGYDAIIQAESGFMFLNGQPESGPTKMPVALIDILAAHQLKEGILAALYLREKTGKGQLVAVSLIQAALSSLANQAANWLVAGFNPRRSGSEHPNIVPYGTLFKTKDHKDLIVAVGDDRQFRNLCLVIGMPELAEMPDYACNSARVKNRVALIEKLKTLISGFTAKELLEELKQKHVPAGLVKDVAEALEAPEAQALNMADDKGLKGLKTIAFTLSDAYQSPAISSPPHFGQHSEEIIRAFTKTGPDLSDRPESGKNLFQAEKIPEKKPGQP